MANSTILKAVDAAVDAKAIEFDRMRAPVLASAYDYVKTAKDTAEDALEDILEAAKDLTDALEANGATIAGCATAIAALKALYPSED